MNVLLNVRAYSPIPSRGNVGDAPEAEKLPDKFLIKSAISPEEAINAVEMIVGLRPDTEAKDNDGSPMVKWDIVRSNEWINNKVFVWNLAD